MSMRLRSALPWLTARGPVLVAALALVFALATRMLGADWGRPALLHIDEMGYNFHAAVRMEQHWAREGWPRPALISYGALPSYAFLATRDLVFGRGRARDGLARAPDEDGYLRGTYGFDPRNARSYYWPAVARAMRLLAALLYTLALALGAHAAARLYGPWTGALAAVTGAACAGLVQHAHYFTPEAFVTLGTAALLHACVAVAQHGRWRDYAWASLAMVLVASSKVTAAPVCVMLVLASYDHARRVRQLAPGAALAFTLDRGRLWAAVVAAVGAWFVLNPAAAREFHWYFDRDTHFSPIEQVYAYRWDARLPDWALFYTDKPRWYFATTVLSDACGAPLAWLSLLAAATMLLLERGPRRYPALFAAIALAPLALTHLQTIRYVVPALPVLLVCAARAIARTGSLSARATDRRVAWLRPAIVVAAALAVGHGAWAAAAQTTVYLREDPRVAAARWLAARVAPGDRVIIEEHPCYTPPLGNEWGEGRVPEDRAVPYERLWVGGEDPGAVARWMQGARFVVLGGWHARELDVPEAWRRHRGMMSFYAGVRARGAPEGYHRVASFASPPTLFGLARDERESELLHVMFDHVPLQVFERNAPAR